MKKIYLSLVLFFPLCFLFSFSFSQTITLGNLGTTSFCPNGTLDIPFTTDLSNGTVFKVFLSSSSGSFTNQTEIGNGISSPITVTFPDYYYLTSSSNYKIRIVSISPSVISNVSPDLSTNAQYMSISVKNLLNQEIYYSKAICNNSALTGIISSNQTGLTYEWKKDGVVQSNNSSFKMTQAGDYQVSIQKIGCSVSSKTINMYFRSQIYHSSIREGEQYQCTGERILYRDSYYSDNVTFQWKKDGNILSGHTKDTLIVNQTGVYTANVVDNCPIISNSDSLNKSVFFSNTIKSVEFSNQTNLDGIICGSNVSPSFYSSYFDPNPLSPYTYQWKNNGINIPNATNYNLYQINQAGLYSLEIKQGNCSVISNGKEVIKKDTIKLNLRVLAPYQKDFCQGLFTYFDYDYISGVNYAFYKNGVASPFNLRITEAGNFVLTGSVSGCTILPSDTLKTTVGNNLKISIDNNRPTICINTANTGKLYFSNQYSSLQNISYQWFRNNQPYYPSSGQSQWYLYPTQSGFYKLRITSGSCVGISDSTEIKYTSQLDKPSFKGSLPSTIQLCSNNLITFGINSGITSNLIQYDSLFWKRNGQIIPKQNLFANYSATQSGTYSVIGKQGSCQTESDPVEIKIGEPITANITGSTSIYAGQKANLALNFTGGNNWSYQTSDMTTGQTTFLSPTIKSVSPTTSQTYTITSFASNCGVGTVSGSATITICPSGKTSSIQSGNWNIPSTWSCGQIPTSTYDTIIENGHIITLPNGYQGETKKLDLRGSLNQGVDAGIKVNK